MGAESRAKLCKTLIIWPVQLGGPSPCFCWLAYESMCWMVTIVNTAAPSTPAGWGAKNLKIENLFCIALCKKERTWTILVYYVVISLLTTWRRHISRKQHVSVAGIKHNEDHLQWDKAVRQDVPDLPRSLKQYCQWLLCQKSRSMCPQVVRSGVAA